MAPEDDLETTLFDEVMGYELASDYDFEDEFDFDEDRDFETRDRY